MKKSVKPLILFFLVFFIMTAVFLLGYMSVKIKCDQLTKEIVLKEDALIVQRKKHVALTAELQKYMSKDRITEIASAELGMIKLESPRIVIEVSKEKIAEINKILQEKYE